MGEMAVVGARTRELILYANIVCESLIHAFLYIVIYDFLFATTSTISMSVLCLSCAATRVVGLFICAAAHSVASPRRRGKEVTMRT